MTNHLKRIAAPKTWNINRKDRTFIIKPNAGGHALQSGLALTVIVRDLLKLANTASEVKKILNNKPVLVNGKRRKDYRYVVGLFDIVSFVDLEKYFKLTKDKKGRLDLVNISKEEAELKFSKIMGKTKLPGGKLQYNLHDGINIICDKEAKVGDTLILSLPKLEVKKVLPLKPGAEVLLANGKHSGVVGQLKEIKGNEVVCQVNKETIETAKKYLFVIK